MSDALKSAEAEARAARERLEGTYRSVRSGLLPAALMPVGKVAGQLARNAVRKRAIKLAIGSAVAARRRPVIAWGVIVAGALYALRNPLAAAWRRRREKETQDERTD
jgi:chromate transport protein ChrA